FGVVAGQPLPACITRRAWLCDRVCAPGFLSARGVESNDKAAAAGARVGATGNAGDYLAFGDQWSPREGVTLAIVGDGRIPDDLSCFGRECCYMRVGSCQDNRVTI